jgi:hypothetical protein
MNPKWTFFLLGSIALLSIFSGCTSAPKINSEFDPAVDFTNYTTFAIVPIPRQIESVDPGLLLRVSPAARAAVEGSMTAKGYTLVDEVDKANIAVLVHGKAVPKTNITATGINPVYAGGWHGRYPYGTLGMSTVPMKDYDEGTLIVEVYEVSNDAENQIWVGWITGGSKKDTANQAANIAESIRLILSNFPDQGSTAAAAAMGSK